MKKRTLLNYILLIILLSNKVTAQNLLPLDWTIHFPDSASFASRNTPATNNVSLLLSWERQNYFGADGLCTLSADFKVDKPDIIYKITSKIQCHIISMKINGKDIATDINTDFWNDKEKSTEIKMPKGILRKGKNSIILTSDNLSYTGGIGHNKVTLTPLANNYKEDVKISVNNEKHLFINQAPFITVSTQTNTKGNLRIKLENDFHKLLLDTVIAIKKERENIKVDLSDKASNPGFYQCTATLHSKGYSGDVLWFGKDPEKIECNNVGSRYFEEYWNKAKSELAAISPDFRMHKSDSLSTGKRDCYIVEMQSLGNLTVRGYYFVPRDSNNHYAVMHVPGYGYGFEDIDHFSKMDTKRIDFALCVRGHGISADIFHPGFGVPGIWGYQLCNSDSVAYRSIYMDCVRAVEFLTSRKEVDKSRIGVDGGSQGGGLTLATAALCNDKIAACAYFDPFPCDIRHAMDIRRICRTEIKNYLKYYNNCCSYNDAMNIQDLLDTRYFAPMIKGKVHFATALFDDDCPSHQGFAAYNLIKSPKQYTIYPNDSHLGESNYGQMFLDWFDEIFK